MFLCFLTSPNLWFLREPGNQALTRRLFWGTSLHLPGQLAPWLKSLPCLKTRLSDLLTSRVESRASLESVTLPLKNSWLAWIDYWTIWIYRILLNCLFSDLSFPRSSYRRQYPCRDMKEATALSMGLNTLYVHQIHRSSHHWMHHRSSYATCPKEKPTCSQLINTQLCILKIIPFSLEFQVNPGILVLLGDPPLLVLPK